MSRDVMAGHRSTDHANLEGGGASSGSALIGLEEASTGLGLEESSAADEAADEEETDDLARVPRGRPTNGLVRKRKKRTEQDRVGQRTVTFRNDSLPAIGAVVRAQTVALADEVKSAASVLVSTAAFVWARQLRSFSDIPIVQRLHTQTLDVISPLVMVSFMMSTVLVTWFIVPLPACGLKLTGSSIVFTVSVVMSALSYHNCVATHPGYIPDDWEGESTGLPILAKRWKNHYDFAVERKKNGELRYCKKEMKFKPDRSHYCRQLSRNVLRMDHYCPYVANGIGFYNQKYFVLFLLYTVIGTNLSAFHMLMGLCSHPAYSAGYTFMMWQGGLLSALLSVILTPFLGFHCWLLSRNLTTIEYCEKVSDTAGFTSPYDIGVLENIKSVMGADWYMWPLPIGTPPGNGMQFPRVERIGDVDPGASSSLAPSFSPPFCARRGRCDLSSDEEEKTTRGSPSASSTSPPTDWKATFPQFAPVLVQETWDSLKCAFGELGGDLTESCRMDLAGWVRSAFGTIETLDSCIMTRRAQTPEAAASAARPARPRGVQASPAAEAVRAAASMGPVVRIPLNGPRIATTVQRRSRIEGELQPQEQPT